MTGIKSEYTVYNLTSTHPVIITAEVSAIFPASQGGLQFPLIHCTGEAS